MNCERVCDECTAEMTEGYVFESDSTQYCSRECLEKVVTWEEYLAIYDEGNGDAYWTVWND